MQHDRRILLSNSSPHHMMAPVPGLSRAGGQLVPVCLRLPQVEHLVFQEPQTSTPGKPRAVGFWSKCW